MGDRLKVMVVLGTRPEIIKLSRVIAELDRCFDLVLVHTGQNYDYELSQVFFEDLGVRAPDLMLGAAGETAAKTVASVIAGVDDALAQHAPDALLVLGDTNSCLAVYPAKRRKVPVFHMEAGNRCYDERVPEEINRRLIDHLSDLNMTYTEHARRALLAEGLRADFVLKTGSPMREVIEYIGPKVETSTVHADLNIDRGGYFVVSAHREENVDEPARLRAFLETLNALAATHGKPVIVSTHGRTRARLEKLDDAPPPHELVRFMKPLGLVDYLALQRGAACVLSDSGTITEESSIMGFPAVTLREAHERPEGMDVGTLVMCGLESAEVLAAVRMVMRQHAERGAPGAPPDYARGDVSRQVARIIASYTGAINRVVWRR